MLFTNIATAALAVLAVLAPSALTAPAPEAVGVEVPVAEVAARAPEDIMAREIDELPTREVEEVKARDLEDLEARQAGTVTLQLFATNTCNSGSGGPHRTYNRNQCVALAAHTRGIKVIRGPCFSEPSCRGGLRIHADNCETVHTYEDGTCGKNPRTFKGWFCLNTQTQPRWSFKVVC
ncbi:hypothetical protein GCG54_00010655 [Colletotrichum gloeosporioides]|uniref:Secreted protein n=1 Tax=Colletotrichum gloeosporioides TaxID=474922 RepID=A0A8H4C839_COLGL|nr:uncharacterized protein GCG54_00010655 [Colletotrichum gloeosporioides]KAF3798982.1 hypothetical protein GCG54_00010655 [Colletotrichum gloeosporioides]